MQRVLILGTGLIGASLGLALRENGFSGVVSGWDRNPAEAETALRRGAIEVVAQDPVQAARGSDAVVLAMPVLAILEWMLRLGPELGEQQWMTDVGSTKRAICDCAKEQYNRAGRAEFLPGHPMAGKETAGAAAAEAALFQGATWLFTPLRDETAASAEWRSWVERFGCRTLAIEAARHDELCAWVSHLPQMVATALAVTLEEELGESVPAIGGRALREMTRLGASPYAMWRDIAETNAPEIALAMRALEQRLARVRKQLGKAELGETFAQANRFRPSRH
ncbi:MAG: prephenate dehydrogenase [Terriglobales bacterium]